MGQPLQPAMPADNVPMVDSNGLLTIQWRIFFAGLSGRSGPIVTVPVGASPFNYTASGTGQLAIVGGTVSVVFLTRARVTFNPAVTAGFFPMAQADVAQIVYSAAPTVYFVPG